MPPKLKIVAEEILMCGLRSIPIAGKAFEVIGAVESRHAMLAQSDRLDEIERNLSRMERRLRDLVEEEIRTTLERLGEPELNGRMLTAEIQNLRSIQQQGWEPTLFEGLLRNSSHWEELKNHPQHYGKVLDGQAPIDPDGIHVLIDREPLRVLELTPFAFAALLANQVQGIPAADIQARADIWAFPSATEAAPTIATPSRRVIEAASGRVVSVPAGGRPRSITNLLGMKLVRIEPGEFLMGSPNSDGSAFDDEKPQHHVRIRKPFYLGVTEVTQGQYQAVMGENPSNFKGSDSLPVELVSWEDAVSFCQKLTAKEGNRLRYRLPTEAEWEYACRAGSATIYPWGDDEGPLGEYAWFSSNSESKTQPVGQKRPNAWGLYDMQGNVWEWCSDWYDEKYYASSPPADPPGGARASNRVFRGGSWHNDPRFCRPAYRISFVPGNRTVYLGFRLAAVQE